MALTKSSRLECLALACPVRALWSATVPRERMSANTFMSFSAYSPICFSSSPARTLGSVMPCLAATLARIVESSFSCSACLASLLSFSFSSSGSLSGLLLELLVVAFPAAVPAETLVDYAVDFLLGEGPQLRVVHVLWGRRALFRLLLAVRAGLVFFCHGWWLLCLFLVSTPDAGELTAILVGFAHGCAPPHRWGVKGKRKAITFRRDGFLGFRDFPALFFARIRTAARRSTHSRRRTSASFLRS